MSSDGHDKERQLCIMRVHVLQILRLTQCHVNEYRQTDSMELMYCGIKMDYESEVEKEVETFDLLATNVNNKAEWIADITQVRGLYVELRSRVNLKT